MRPTVVKGAVSSCMDGAVDRRVHFMCPGCNEIHGVVVERRDNGPGPLWTWNDSLDAPTFRPSINVTWKTPSEIPEEFDDETKDVSHVCHTWVTDGVIEFLSDCTHALAGHKVALPPWPQKYD